MSERRCPHCKQPIQPAARPARICCRCDQPITAHMKWRFISKGRRTMIEHRHCDHPYDYVVKV